MDDLKIYIETFELASASVYLLAAWKHENPVTKLCFAGCILMFYVDIFILQGIRSDLTWLGMNTPFVLLCYEKIYRKYLLSVSRKLAAYLLAMLGL